MSFDETFGLFGGPIMFGLISLGQPVLAGVICMFFVKLSLEHLRIMALLTAVLCLFELAIGFYAYRTSGAVMALKVGGGIAAFGLVLGAPGFLVGRSRALRRVS